MTRQHKRFEVLDGRSRAIPAARSSYFPRNGKTAGADRRRNFESARGSALECAAVQDVLVGGKALDKTESQSRKMELDRMAAMLGRLGGRGDQIREDRTIYGDERNDFDPDFDRDLDEDAKEPRPSVARDP